VLATDFDHVPSGDLGWLELVEHSRTYGDWAEADFLELKSDLDFSKAGKATAFSKIAKYVLGSANRSVEAAERHLGGHGLLLIGVATGEVPGTQPLDPKDLHAGVQPFLGVHGPSWDSRVIRVVDKDVLAVIVPHPGYGHGPFLCRKSGVEVTDGHVYIRVPGETRQAKATEVEMLQDRGRRRVAATELMVTLTGCVTHIDRDEFFAHLEREINDLVSDQLGTVSTSAMGSGALALNQWSRDSRTPEEFRVEVDRWRTDAMRTRPDAALELFIRLLPLGRVSLRNLADRYLTDVVLDVALPDGVEAMLVSDSAHCLNHGLAPAARWPQQPEPFGTSPMLAYRAPKLPPMHKLSDLTLSQSTLSFAVGDLRPRKTATSDDEFALIAYEHGLPESLTLEWTITAKGMDAAISGTLTVATETRDISRRQTRRA